VAARDALDRIEPGTLHAVTATDATASAERRMCEVRLEPTGGFDVEGSEFFIAVPEMESTFLFVETLRSKTADAWGMIPEGLRLKISEKP
jgi:hypothetical protein